jgi:hypothetical protein
MKEYLVERNPQLLILMSEEEIRQQLDKGQLRPTTRVYEDKFDRWLELGQIPAFATYRSQALPVPAPVYSHPAQKKEWYALHGLSPIGPLSYVEVLRLVQNKRLSPSQLVWKSGMADWKAICYTLEFHPENLKKLALADFPMLKWAFAQRKSQRVAFQSEFILHTDKQFWRAKSYEIGSGGVGLLIEGKIEKNEVFYLHHLSRSGLSTFSAMGQVVSHLIDHRGILPDKWGIEFIDIRSTDQAEINTYVQKNSGLLRLSSR